MTVICKECNEVMEYREKYGRKNKRVYVCNVCGNIVFQDTMWNKAGKTIIIVPDE